MLEIGMLPGDTWEKNVRTKLSTAQWDQLRRKVYQRAEYTCQTCGDRHSPLHCHEVWEFDDEKKIQKLIELQAVCAKCHGVIHFGSSAMNGHQRAATKHLMVVNAWDRHKAGYEIRKAVKQWNHRNQFRWTVDMSSLKELCNGLGLQL